jgi:hypothetical protein
LQQREIKWTVGKIIKIVICVENAQELDHLEKGVLGEIFLGVFSGNLLDFKSFDDLIEKL